MERRELIRGAAFAAFAAGFMRPSQLLAASEEDAILATVNPQLRAMAKRIIPYTLNGPPASAATLTQQRAIMTTYAAKPLPDVPVETRVVPGSKTQPDVVVYVVNAGSGAPRPGIIHTHGGGFFSGSAKSAVRACQEIAKAIGCVVVSVEYRLAPEVTWAGSVEDNYAALRWVHANAAALGIDAGRLAVMGESAGGGHAALLAIAARDRGEIPISFQCLTYPMLDDRTGSSRPAPPHVGKIIWTAESNRYGWESFLGVKPGGRSAPPAVPARVKDLAGLPPAWIGVGSIDLFHDEDVDYARRLNDSFVPTELIVVPGAFHGFDSPTLNAPISNWFIAARLDALRQAFGMSGT